MQWHDSGYSKWIDLSQLRQILGKKHSGRPRSKLLTFDTSVYGPTHHHVPAVMGPYFQEGQKVSTEPPGRSTGRLTLRAVPLLFCEFVRPQQPKPVVPSSAGRFSTSSEVIQGKGLSGSCGPRTSVSGTHSGIGMHRATAVATLFIRKSAEARETIIGFLTKAIGGEGQSSNSSLNPFLCADDENSDPPGGASGHDDTSAAFGRPQSRSAGPSRSRSRVFHSVCSPWSSCPAATAAADVPSTGCCRYICCAACTCAA